MLKNKSLIVALVAGLLFSLPSFAQEIKKTKEIEKIIDKVIDRVYPATAQIAF